MPPPPREIDGAVVLRVAYRNAAQDFGTVYFKNDNRSEPIAALAIARYPGRRDQVYVFACNSKWEVVGDILCYSEELGTIAAEGHYGVPSIYWTVIDSYVSDTGPQASDVEAREQTNGSTSDVTDDALRTLISEGNELEAIRRLRLRKGLSLHEAHQYVGRFRNGGLDDPQQHSAS